MEDEFTVNKSNESTCQIEITDDLTTIRTILKQMCYVLKASQKKSRERAFVITKLDEARMWALEAMITDEVEK